MTLLVTGTAGFIGFHLAKRLLAHHTVIGLDNLNTYYDVRLKRSRLEQLKTKGNFHNIIGDISDAKLLEQVFKQHRPNLVVNLAAQAGVRYSLTNPQAYIHSNIVGFGNILECCRQTEVEHLVFASSSSVYGLNTKMPFSEHDLTGHPISLYAATKRANELMAHVYSHLYRLPVTGLRFFTVYGPWGRPDMALFKFTRNILRGEPITVYNNGQMSRDFTYIDDIIEGVVRIIGLPAQPDRDWDSEAPNPASAPNPFRIYNIGSSAPVPLMRFIRVLEDVLGKKAIFEFVGMQPGDVANTYSDRQELFRAVGYSPTTSVEVGVKNFVDWYLDYYGHEYVTLDRTG